MKNLDFFRQPKRGNIKSTVYGGAVSLFSLFVLTILIGYQMVTFEETSVVNEVVVENNRMAENSALIMLNLTLEDVSCLLINPMISSDVDSSVSSIEDTFTKTRIYQKDGETVWAPEADFVSKIENADNEEDLKKIIEDGLVKGES